MKIKLIIDDRERAIFPYLETELYNVNYIVKRINIGDYSLIDENNNIVACIERKSLKDFAASIKDGRYGNKAGMMELREKTNCKLFYIIEGDAFPKPSKTYGHIPYKYIESAIFHLMIRDGFFIIETNNVLHTAQKLSRLIESIGRLKENIINELMYDINDDKYQVNNVNGKICENPFDKEIDTLFDEIYGAKEPSVIPNELLSRQKKTDIDIVREMWACFKGISVITADTFINQACIADIIRKKFTREQIENLKYSSGKKINKRVITSLTYLCRNVETRLLACIPGVSIKTAKEMIDKTRLKPLLSYEPESISIITVGKKKVGIARANAIKKYFEFICPVNK